MHGVKARIVYILKHNMLINRIIKFMASIVLRFIGLFIPLDQNAILFSGQNQKYNDSPRVIYESMINCPRFSDYHFIWALDDPCNIKIPGECTKIKADTFAYFKASLSCKYWVSSVNIERGLKYKKNKTIYLNTWHGTPLKTIGNSAAGRKDYDFSNIDYFCSAGRYEEKIYIRDFKLNPSGIINTGLPRNDELYETTPEEAINIKEKLHLPKNKKVILYAPTWRDSSDCGKTYQIKPPINLDIWKQKLEEDYILLLRLHPYTNKLLGVCFNEFIRDYTHYPNINEILKITDILISDYSAIIFDFSILEKPIICFGYDYENYVDARGLYLNLETTVPGGVMKTQEEVLNRILHCDWTCECAMTRDLKNKFLEYGGHATEICIKKLFGKQKTMRGDFDE